MVGLCNAQTILQESLPQMEDDFNGTHEGGLMKCSALFEYKSAAGTLAENARQKTDDDPQFNDQICWETMIGQVGSFSLFD